ncbi:glycoside hydrolase family 47 protein [Tilletiaria anomala UBC 951]|uniref:alpha-1,2-Mannosidase n=1 Tax=Tilletiaria anomala (strain ATCC 24038 / CBS 436.72 / UBC 951) TaxID=1037660 RepID=A0A066WFS0_TILAU|nr:glycoside hydrolase family 47 protein [Tilletiaria anomala UBC 951]KDN52651.1 glycoside hydrolase family 47 protein [Tilletiaria anomala UBC 951]
MAPQSVRDRNGYLPLSLGFTPATSQGGSFARTLFTRRTLSCVLFVLVVCTITPVYLLKSQLLGEDRMRKLGLEEWIPSFHAPEKAAHEAPPPMPVPSIGSSISANIPPLSHLNFPPHYYDSLADVAQLYPNGNPHAGIIPSALLAMIEVAPASQPPPRPALAARVPEALHAPHNWSVEKNGSTTRFEDTFKASEQSQAPDFRTGTRYAGWQPPLADLNETRRVQPLPKVQFAFPAPDKFSGKQGSPQRDALIRHRQKLVKNAFVRSWEGYKKYAWGHDELKPLSNGSSDPFNGWGATIVDALDTLLVMDLPAEYNYARQHVHDIDFTLISGERSAYGSSDGRIPVFETAIRYLGGLLSAYDLSGDELMRDRAEELGQLIMPAFKTMSGVPVGRLRMGDTNPASSDSVILSEATSLLLEFTRLWQATGNRTYFDQVQRTTDWFNHNITSSGRLGTLLPTNISPDSKHMYGLYSFGGMADSYYEYLIKEYQLLGGRVDQYKHMYSHAIRDAKKFLYSVVDSVPNTLLLLVGISTGTSYTAKLEHLACFSGAMVGLGAKLLPDRAEDIHDATRLTETCYWSYNSTLTGIGPEDITFYQTGDPDRFDVMSAATSNGADRHGRARGNPQVGVRGANGDYRNRPETIESVFYMWRITGDEVWQERGWQMFASWVTHSMTESGFAGIVDVNRVPVTKMDNMESFAFAETFKYYYLLFSPPDLISLDDYVFTTEAHPLLVPKNGRWTQPGHGPKKFWKYDEGAQKLAGLAAAAKMSTGGDGASSPKMPYIGGEGGTRIGAMTNVQKHALLRAHQAASELQLARSVSNALHELALRELALEQVIAQKREAAAAGAEGTAAEDKVEEIVAALRRDPQGFEDALQGVVINVAEPHVRRALRALLDRRQPADTGMFEEEVYEEDEEEDVEGEKDALLDRALHAYARAHRQQQEAKETLATATVGDGGELNTSPLLQMPSSSSANEESGPEPRAFGGGFGSRGLRA